MTYDNNTRRILKFSSLIFSVYCRLFTINLLFLVSFPALYLSQIKFIIKFVSVSNVYNCKSKVVTIYKILRTWFCIYKGHICVVKQEKEGQRYGCSTHSGRVDGLSRQ